LYGLSDHMTGCISSC